MRASIDLPELGFLPAHPAPGTSATSDVPARLAELGFEMPGAPANFTVDFRQNWTLWYSLREFVQNSLDATGTVEIDISKDSRGRVMTSIIDEGSGIGAKNLLLGQRKGTNDQPPAEKLRDQYLLRGRYGEGLKYALIPLIRHQLPFMVRTVGFDFTAYVANRKLFSMQKEDIEDIFYFLRPNKVTSGTTVAILGMDASALDLVEHGVAVRVDATKRFFLPQSKNVIVQVPLPQPRWGGASEQEKVLRASVRRAVLRDEPGVFYVRDVYVTDRSKQEKWAFGYNLWFDDSVEALDPNRDALKWDKVRQEVLSIFLADQTGEAVKALATRLVGAVGKGEDPKSLQEFVLLDQQWDAYQGSLSEASNALSKLDAYMRQAVGGDYAASTDTDGAKAIEHASVKDVSKILPRMITKALEAGGFIKTEQAYIETVSRSDPLILDEKGKLIKEALGLSLGRLTLYPIGDMSALGLKFSIKNSEDWSEVRGRGRSQEWRVAALLSVLNKGCEAVLTIAKSFDPSMKAVRWFVPASVDKKDNVLGYYSPAIKEIHLNLRTTRGINLIDTVLHEVAHAQSGAGDLTEPFQVALTKVSSYIMEMMMARRPSRLTRDVVKAVKYLYALGVMLDEIRLRGGYDIDPSGTRYDKPMTERWGGGGEPQRDLIHALPILIANRAGRPHTLGDY